jgi:hypothetical protein
MASKPHKSSRPRPWLTLLLWSQSTTDSHAWLSLRFATRRVSWTGALYGDGLSAPPKTHRIVPAVRRLLSVRSAPQDDADVVLLKSENSDLRDTIRKLEEENQKLKQRAQRVVGLENFEGERFFRSEMEIVGIYGEGLTAAGDEVLLDETWCDGVNEGKCIQRLNGVYDMITAVDSTDLLAF